MFERRRHYGHHGRQSFLKACRDFCARRSAVSWTVESEALLSEKLHLVAKSSSGQNADSKIWCGWRIELQTWPGNSKESCKKVKCTLKRVITFRVALRWSARLSRLGGGASIERFE